MCVLYVCRWRKPRRSGSAGGGVDPSARSAVRWTGAQGRSSTSSSRTAGSRRPRGRDRGAPSRCVTVKRLRAALASGGSVRGIRARLGRAPSTISRAVARHGGRARYRACVADGRTWDRARRPKPCRLAGSAALRALVAAAANRGVAHTDVSGPSSPPGVARDDLGEPVCAESRRAEERADRPSSPPAADAPGAAGDDGGTRTRAHH